MVNVPEADYEDGNDASDDGGNIEEVEYVAPVACRSRGVQPVPRFDIQLLRPFEVMFVDNKDFDMEVRGGRRFTLVLYDLKSTAKFVVEVSTKAQNRNAFPQIVAQNGVHKLPYHCCVYTDGLFVLGTSRMII